MKPLWNTLWSTLTELLKHALEIAVGVYVGLYCIDQAGYTIEILPAPVHTQLVVVPDTTANHHLTEAIRTYTLQQLEWHQQVLKIDSTRFHNYVNN